MPELKSYRFDIGNSTDGPIGAVMRVHAESPEQAVTTANNALDWIGSLIQARSPHYVEYFNIYLNDDLKLTASDIGDVEEI